MEMERPWWLYAACGVSLCVHIVVGANSRNLPVPRMLAEGPTEIEVALEPLPEPKPEPRADRKRPLRERRVRIRNRIREERRVRREQVRMAVKPPEPRLPRPERENPRPVERERPAPRIARVVPEEKPSAAPIRRSAPAPILRMAKADIPRLDTPREPEKPRDVVPDPPRERPAVSVPGERPDPSPRLGSGRERSVLGGETQFEGLGPRDEKPVLSTRPSGSGGAAPLLRRMAEGASRSPLAAGREESRRPQPDEQPVSSRAGAPGAGPGELENVKEGPRRSGGSGLLAAGNPLAGLGPDGEERISLAGTPDGDAAARARRLRRQRRQMVLTGDEHAQRAPGAGDGGGRKPVAEGGPDSIRFEPGEPSSEKITVRNVGRGGLAVENLLAKETTLDEAPGLGSRPEGSRGEGSGRELGLSGSRSRDRAPRGSGSDEPAGRRPGARGLEADLPSGGGTGLGDGGGSGNRADGGSRSRAGGLDLGKENPLGDGERGGRSLGRGGRVTLGSEGRGDLLGGGGRPDGDGSEGRGIRERPGGGSPPGGRVKELSGPAERESKPRNGVHIVYVVDVSPSTTWKTKMLRAKGALRKALSELEATDSFTIMDFANDVRTMSDGPVKPTKENIDRAFEYLDGLKPRGQFTNMSAALEQAFGVRPLTHLYLLSDGEATAGVSDPEVLRRKVREMNTQKAQILTIALERGEKAFGVPLLRWLAQDSDGVFTYLERGR